MATCVAWWLGLIDSLQAFFVANVGRGAAQLQTPPTWVNLTLIVAVSVIAGFVVSRTGERRLAVLPIHANNRAVDETGPIHRQRELWSRGQHLSRIQAGDRGRGIGDREGCGVRCSAARGRVEDSD